MEICCTGCVRSHTIHRTQRTVDAVHLWIAAMRPIGASKIPIIIRCTWIYDCFLCATHLLVKGIHRLVARYKHLNKFRLCHFHVNLPRLILCQLPHRNKVRCSTACRVNVVHVQLFYCKTFYVSCVSSQ